jgi:hypothetical protein
LSNNWVQIVIEDPPLSGESLVRLLQIVLGSSKITTVVVCNVEGAGIDSLRQEYDQVPHMSIDRFVESASSAKQFDWGDFYLCDSEENALAIACDEKPHGNLTKAAGLIRAVDDTYFYIYTPSDALRFLIGPPLSIQEVKISGFDDLDFPC